MRVGTCVRRRRGEIRIAALAWRWRRCCWRWRSRFGSCRSTLCHRRLVTALQGGVDAITSDVPSLARSPHVMPEHKRRCPCSGRRACAFRKLECMPLGCGCYIVPCTSPPMVRHDALHVFLRGQIWACMWEMWDSRLESTVPSRNSIRTFLGRLIRMKFDEETNRFLTKKQVVTDNLCIIIPTYSNWFKSAPSGCAQKQ